MASMCANYHGVDDVGILSDYFGVEVFDELAPVQEAFPLGASPFIRLDALGRRRVEDGMFGLLPHFAKELKYGRNTYNACSETITTKISFRKAWSRSQRCIVPAKHIFEQYYEPVLPNEPPAKPVRWKINSANGEPLAIAGVYNTWQGLDGDERHTFTMLTVNADQHPFMKKFHAPGEEKRMVVILARHELDDWLTCSHDEAKKYFRMWDGELVGVPAPLKPKTPKPKAEMPPPPPNPQGDLFST